MSKPSEYIVQWMDNAGIHNARIQEINGAITLMTALRHVGGYDRDTLNLFAVYPDRTVKVPQ